MPTVGKYAYILKWKVAVAAARKAGPPLRLAHSVRHLGDAYTYAGRAALAEPCYVEALSIYRRNESTPPLDLANAIRGYAVLKDQLGVAQDTEPLWHEAHDLYAAVQVSAGVAECAARLALLARRAGDLEHSLEWLTEARTAADAANDPETFQYVREVTEIVR